jgi:hypothetical protein
MIVWDGYDGFTFFDNGGRYDPLVDSWTATSTIDAPSARYYHTAVWTGSEMVVWGGEDVNNSFPITGGRYRAPGTSASPTPTHALEGVHRRRGRAQLPHRGRRSKLGTLWRTSCRIIPVTYTFMTSASLCLR